MDQTPDDLSELFSNQQSRSGYVKQMFGEIAPKYDLVNRLMTFGLDARWRKAVARAAVAQNSGLVVDAGTGSGELALACARLGAQTVIGLDFALPMLENAQTKSQNLGVPNSHFVSADATRLPLAANIADAWTGAFVLRNIPDLDGALQEALRVLRPGGRLITLDAARLQPRSLIQRLLAPGARFHFNKLVPLIGKLISGHSDAYQYLPMSAENFFTPTEFSLRLRKNGFEVLRSFEYVAGTVMLHIAMKPEAAPE